LLGVDSRDVDCEVHGLEIGRVEALLQERGEVNFVGKAFGVFKLSSDAGVFDISLPRVDLGVDAAQLSPNIGLHQAALRRDLRCNALFFDPISDEVIDTVEGCADIREGRLRVVDPNRFGEDPLRALRAARFCASLGFVPDDELVGICREMDLGSQPVERIWSELRRLLLSAHPEKGIRALRRLGLLGQVLSELEEEQAEALSEALERAVPVRNALVKQEGALCVMVSVLVSSFAEPRRSSFFTRLKIEKPGGIPVRRIALGLAEQLPLSSSPSDSRLRHLVEVCELSWVLAAAKAWTPGLDVEACFRRGQELGIGQAPLPVLLRGSDLEEQGIQQGPEMGVMMRAARKAQLDGVFSTRPEALAWLVAEIASDSKPR